MTDRHFRIAAHLGVKDEVELIGPCVDHLRRIGVDEFIVHDIASRDGTREWLRKEEGEAFRVFDVGNEASEECLNESVQAAVQECRADWILMLDADEFPLPREGNLREALRVRSEDLVVIPRYNVALGLHGPHMPLPPLTDSYQRIDLFVRADPEYRRRLTEDRTLVWLRAVPAPKCAFRPSRVGRISAGGHGALPKPGAALASCIADDIVIAHLALSRFERFARKISNVQATLKQVDGQVGENWGWHWRRWAALDAAGELEGEFNRSRISINELAKLRATGDINTAANLLKLRQV